MARTKNLFLLCIFLLCTGLSVNTYAGPVCGDGTVDTEAVPPEQCDDGNLDIDDGCSDTCTVESGYECSGQPSVCTLFCADFVSAPTSCGVGECAATGETTCDAADGTIGDSCVEGTPTDEICDGLDNDCNEIVDDGIAPVASTCGVGECAATGEITCEGGVEVDSCVDGTPSAEICDDSLDNDCDGDVDASDADCSALCDAFVPETISCGVGECAATADTTCDPATGLPIDNCVAGTPGTEICDGLDNDCNEIVDDGIAPAPSTCGVGECAATGEVTCEGGVEVDSCVAGTPGTEICDGLDNDCNEIVDDGIAPVATTCGVGECAATGEVTCEGGVEVDNCVAGTPSAETCDGLDNDCDGTNDEEIAPVATSCGIGECTADGQITCEAGSEVVSCTPGTPSAETCDGLDNDCDGTNDEEIAPVASTCGVGTCAATGEITCVGEGTEVNTCTPGTPGDEVCDDGLDNDCNGSIDELPICTDPCAGFVSEPTSCGVGLCAATGVSTCDSATGAIGDSCVAGTPGDEICDDGLDNDCNGAIDDAPVCTELPETVTEDLPDGGTVAITTAAGEGLSGVTVGDATGGPSDISFTFGVISYTTSVPNPGDSVTVRMEFSDNLPENLVLFKVDAGGVYTELPASLWTQVNSNTVDVTLTDGDSLTDLDGAADGSIDDPIAVGGEASFPFFGGDGGGGCTLSTSSRSRSRSSVDPIWLFLLVAPGIGYLRRRVGAPKRAA